MEFTQEDLDNIGILHREIQVYIHATQKALKKETDIYKVQRLTKNLKNLVLVSALIENYDTRNLHPKRITRRDQKRIAQKA